MLTRPLPPGCSPVASAVGLPKWPLIYQFNSYLKFCISKHGVEQATPSAAPFTLPSEVPFTLPPSLPPSPCLCCCSLSCQLPVASSHLHTHTIMICVLLNAQTDGAKMGSQTERETPREAGGREQREQPGKVCRQLLPSHRLNLIDLEFQLRLHEICLSLVSNCLPTC